jgi:hypothetical protein
MEARLAIAWLDDGLPVGQPVHRNVGGTDHDVCNDRAFTVCATLTAGATGAAVAPLPPGLLMSVSLVTEGGEDPAVYQAPADREYPLLLLGSGGAVGTAPPATPVDPLTGRATFSLRLGRTALSSKCGGQRLRLRASLLAGCPGSAALAPQSSAFDVEVETAESVAPHADSAPFQLVENGANPL